MTSPEEALELARARAAAARAEGRYADDLRGMRVAPTDRITTEQLLDWAVIEPDLDYVRSTRRAGAPITWFKRLVFRVLRQYFAQLESQGTRFNLQVMVRVAEQEDRLARLEERLARLEGERSSSTRS